MSRYVALTEPPFKFMTKKLLPTTWRVILMSKKSGDEHRNLVEQLADVPVTDGFCKSTSHSAEDGIVDAPVPRRKKRAGRSVTQNILMKGIC